MAGEIVFITGATGFVGFAVLLEALKAGYRVRISVRRASQAEELESHQLIAPFVSKVECVVVPAITAEGAFDETLEGVTYILHVASPLPKPTEDPERDIVLPAIHGTTSILNSALKFPSIKRVVITSSVVAILSDAVASNGSSTPISSSSRVRPLPTPPYNPSSAYRAAKALALDATDRFVAEKKPGFSVINIMPGYIIGRNESVTSTRELVSGSNALVLGIVLGSEPMPGKRPMMVTDLRDVARVEVAALDLEKLKVGEGDSKSFLLDGGSLVTGRKLNDAKEIVRKAFPAAVEEGKLKLGGGVGSAGIVVESKDSTKTFGELQGYEAMVKELVGQYLELLDREERIL